MNHQARAPLRLLLVTDGPTIPNWLFRCINAVEQSHAAKVVLVWQAAPEARRGVRGWGQRLRHVLFALHKHIDRHLFRRIPDALAPVSLVVGLPRRRVLDSAELGAPRTGSQPGNGSLVRALQEERIDLVLDLFSLTPDGRLAELCKYGVWSTTFGQRDDPRTQSTPAFWEIIEGRPSTETRLWIHGKGVNQNLLLYTSVAPTDRRSLARGQNHVYWKISAALARNVQKLWEDGDGFLERLSVAPSNEVATGAARPPGNLEMVRAWACLVRRYVADKWVNALYREQWGLAYHRGVGNGAPIGAFRQVIPPIDRLWADPFPIRVGTDYYIFHEELLFSTGKGRIVLTIVDAQGNVAAPIPILERDYHLSYPFVFQWEGDFFMMPETGFHDQVELYRCVAFPSRWKLERVLLSGLRAFDPTPAFLFGKWWLFTNIPAYGIPGTSEELHLFYADSPAGPWIAHRDNPIKSDVRSARPAGRIFERQGQYYRPAQDCSRRYGHAVSINRILHLSPERYEEVEVDRIIPSGSPSVTGVHTFNQADDLTVIDCLVRRNRLWSDHG